MTSPAITASEDIEQLPPPSPLANGIKQECDDPPPISDQNQTWNPNLHPHPTPNIDDKPDEGRAPSPPALTNGNPQDDDNHGQHPDAPPAKRRKIADEIIVSAKASPRPSSPPWKSVHAAGPTSFVENGKRRSGRTNAVPLEMQPHSNRRQTRAAFEKTAEKHTKPSYNEAKKILPAPSHNKTSSIDKLSKKIPAKSSREMPSSAPIKKEPTHKAGNKDELQKQLSQLKARLRHDDISSDGDSLSSSDLESELSSLSSEPEAPISPRINLTKVTFRLNVPKPTIGSPLHLPQPRQHSSFDDFLDNNNIQDPAARPPATDDQIRRDAAERIHVRRARRPGSVASAPKSQDPPRQFAHLDHLLAHALHFRGLLRRESAAHRRAAQTLAHEAKRYLEEKAKSGRVKTVAELQQEELLLNHNRYKTVVKDLTRLWLAVDAEVMAMRRKQYEAEQQAKIKGHLSRVLDRTTQMLRRHDAELSDSELMTNDDDDEDADDDDDNESDAAQSSADSEQMSADDSDTDGGSSQAGDSDAEMTLEELRAKYDDIPALEREDSTQADLHDAMSESNQAEEDSDPETVMDSELDTSDSGDDSEDGDSEGEDESDDDEQQHGGLMSLLFSKRELASAKSAVSTDAPEGQLEETQSVVHDEEADANDNSIEASTLSEGIKPQVNTVEVEDTTNAKTVPMDLDQTSINEGDMEVDTPESRDQSARISPVTSTSKATELESASSIEQHVEAVSDPKPSVSTPIPPLLRGTLREYQHEGLDWLAKLYADGRSGILADEMGLGKTIQSIALLAHLATTYEVWGPHLIVVPTSVMLNWEMEFKKFLPGFKILTYYGDIAERKAKRRGWMAEDSFNVCITSYQLVLKDAVSFKKRRWHYMILDEAHNIKNFRSERWQTMMTFNTRARLLLTGTPLQNNLTELWSLLFFLHYGQEDEGEDGPFAGLAEWSEWFKKPVQSILEHGNQVLDREDQEQVVKLHKVIRPFLLRRLKRDVEKQMPLKYEHVEMCRLSKRQRQLYDGFMSRAQTRETLASGNYLSIINALMQLRKVCNHPDLFETRPINTSFAMSRAVAADFEIRDLLVRRRLLNTGPLDEVDLNFLALGPLSNEKVSRIAFIEMVRLNARVPFAALREQQWARVRDRSKIFSAANRREVRSSLESDARWTRLQLIDRTMYYEAYKHNQRPLYGPSLLQKLQLDTKQRLLSKSAHDTQLPRFWETSPVVQNANLSQSVESLSHRLEPLVAQFACVTPKVVAVDFAKTAVPEIRSEAVRSYPATQPSDPFHQAQMKLSIAFPDKRLLQYDCGKLQRLDGLLRRLQAGGHRALIFTQMTKVLDILEQFLNIHGHRYLRLDGATKIEQRQILTDRFNNDNRILCFILSSRSGGLGINLTGADTVIFYDLDWNPAMDKQCTDRAHRIGQTRDVHIYRFVSEHTIEANILRKANQKQLLDDVVIQEGDFTTDYLNRTSYKDMLVETPPNDDVAGAAMDRLLGGGVDSKGTTFEQAEDKEDIAAARVAANEVQHADDGDFDESLATTKGTTSGKGLTSDPFSATDAAIAEASFDSDENGFRHIDDYLMRMQQFLYKDLPLSYGLKDKSKKNRRKKGAEPRMRR